MSPLGSLLLTLLNSLIGTAANLVGCAHRPAAALTFVQVAAGTRWLLAHEVGHVLGLTHVSVTNTDSLMLPTTGWTNVPPDLAGSEYDTMLNSNLTSEC